MISFIRIRVVCYDWDNKDKILNALRKLLEGVEYKIKESKGEGLISTNLFVYEVELKKKKDIEKFLKNLTERIEDKENFLNNINFDENFNAYLRIDKNTLVNEDKVYLVQHGDVFHVKISFSLPKKDKEKVLEIFKNLLHL